MGMFIKFKCMGCDEAVCSCGENKTTAEKTVTNKSNTVPFVFEGDAVMQNNIEYRVTKVDSEGNAYKKKIKYYSISDETLLEEPYLKIESILKVDEL